jgi:hypothetical protein
MNRVLIAGSGVLITILLTGCSSKPESAPTATSGGSGAYKFGDTIDFSSPIATPYLLGGWSGPENGWGDWTVGPESELLFDIPDIGSSDLALEAKMHPFVPAARPKFSTIVYANGDRIAKWDFNAGEDPAPRTALIPRSALHGSSLRIKLENSDPRSPSETGGGADSRKLSLALMSVTLRSR